MQSTCEHRTRHIANHERRSSLIWVIARWQLCGVLAASSGAGRVGHIRAEKMGDEVSRLRMLNYGVGGLELWLLDFAVCSL